MNNKPDNNKPTKSSLTVRVMSSWFCPSENTSVPSFGLMSIALPAGMPPDWLTLQYTETFPKLPPCLVTVKVTGVPPDRSTTTRDWDSGVKPKRPKASSLGSILTVRTLPMLLRLGVMTSGRGGGVRVYCVW